MRLDLIYLYVADAERSRQFYQQHLDLTEVAGLVRPPGVALALPDRSLIFCILPHTLAPVTGLGSGPSGMVLNFRVQNCRDYYIRWLRSGLEVVGEVERSLFMETATVRDPDGNLISVFHYHDR